MKHLSYKTQSVSRRMHQKSWYIVDMEGQSLGRACTQIASILRGKHKPSYTPHDDAGDCVIVVNAEKVTLTGNKWDGKLYRRHTGYPGGLKEATAREVLNKDPRKLVEKSVRGMLPKNTLGRDLFRKLYVYVGTEHPHTAQKPIEVKFKEKNNK